MRNVLLIARREVGSLFATPTAWALVTLYQVLGGFMFCYVLYYSRWADLSPLHVRLAALLVLLFPILAMGRIANERRQGTMELLLTCPISAGELVAGKFLALAAFGSLLALLSLQYPLVLSAYGSPDPGQWLPATLGLALTAALLAAVGLFASSLTANPVLAGVLALTLSLFLWWFHAIGALLDLEATAVFSGLSLLQRFATMNRGILDSRDLFYFAGSTVFWLGLAARGVESDRW
jgi:ABC-2 type transport system permease protein